MHTRTRYFENDTESEKSDTKNDKRRQLPKHEGIMIMAQQVGSLITIRRVHMMLLNEL